MDMATVFTCLNETVPFSDDTKRLSKSRPLLTSLKTFDRPSCRMLSSLQRQSITETPVLPNSWSISKAGTTLSKLTLVSRLNTPLLVSLALSVLGAKGLTLPVFRRGNYGYRHCRRADPDRRWRYSGFLGFDPRKHYPTRFRYSVSNHD